MSSLSIVLLESLIHTKIMIGNYQKYQNQHETSLNSLDIYWH